MPASFPRVRSTETGVGTARPRVPRPARERSDTEAARAEGASPVMTGEAGMRQRAGDRFRPRVNPRASADTPAGLLGLSVYRNELLYVYNGASEWENINDTVYVVQANDLVKLNADHTVRFELDYRNNAATSDAVLAGNVGYQVYSASTMWDWQISPSVSLTNAVRFDHFALNQSGTLVPVAGYPSSAYNDRTINQPSFNTGLVWKVTDRDTLRFLAARGLQLPSIYDLALQDREPPGSDGQGYLFLGNPDVNAAAINNLEVDWDRSVPSLMSTLRTAVWVQRTDNILINPYETTPVGDGVLLDGVEEQRAVAQNAGYSSAAGSEIGLRGHSPSGWRWDASYSFITIWDHLAINQTGIYSPQNFQQGTPAHAIVLTGGYTVGKWEFDLQTRWQSWFLDYRANPASVTLQPVVVGNYLLADARAGYRLTDNITVALSLQQFNTSHLLVSAGPSIERRAFLSLTVHL